jgi:hypothetical protein
MSWLYAFFHSLARGLAAASISSLVAGKIEAFGLHLEPVPALSVSLVLFVLAVIAARVESWTEKVHPHMHSRSGLLEE